MRQHEANSQKLKDCECRLIRHTDMLMNVYTVRFALKDMEKEFDKTEEDIKAIQSVGQIIAEVMKQLDDDRCAHHANCEHALPDDRLLL